MSITHNIKLHGCHNRNGWDIYCVQCRLSFQYREDYVWSDYLLATCMYGIGMNTKAGYNGERGRGTPSTPVCTIKQASMFLSVLELRRAHIHCIPSVLSHMSASRYLSLNILHPHGVKINNIIPVRVSHRKSC